MSMTKVWRKTGVAECESAARPSNSRLRMHFPLLICMVAFVLRILAMGMVQHWPLNEKSGLWKSGLEIVNIASSISSHKGFSSPFGIDSGPTAWIPPIYPALVAAIFTLFGPRSNAAAMTILTAQALFSALTCIPLYAIAKRAFDENCALWSTWGWALFPYEVLVPGLFVWETCLSCFLMALLCYFSMNLSPDDRWEQISAGALWAIAALTNTALIAAMPIFLFAPHLKRPVHFPYKAIATVILVALLVVCPWVVRNRHVLSAIVPVRSNFGEELWVGNHEGGIGRIESGLGPADNEAEREHYRSVGEISYVAERRAKAMHFILESPAGFLRRAFYRFRYWWFAEGEAAPLFTLYRFLTLISFAGIALALLRINTASVLTIVGGILIYPLVYYVTDVYPRYRYPIEPFLMLFAGLALSRLLVLDKKGLHWRSRNFHWGLKR